jgi:hypothetical protein
MMSVVSAMSVMRFTCRVMRRLQCLYLPTHTLTTDTTDIDNVIVRARERSDDNFEGSAQNNSAAARDTTKRGAQNIRGSLFERKDYGGHDRSFPLVPAAHLLPSWEQA